MNSFVDWAKWRWILETKGWKNMQTVMRLQLSGWSTSWRQSGEPVAGVLAAGGADHVDNPSQTNCQTRETEDNIEGEGYKEKQQHILTHSDVSGRAVPIMILTSEIGLISAKKTPKNKQIILGFILTPQNKPADKSSQLRFSLSHSNTAGVTPQMGDDCCSAFE